MSWTGVYAFPECAEGARRLADELGVPFHVAELHRFPDGESLVRLPEPVRRPVLYRPLHRPNDKLVEILLAASVLRRGGAETLCLVAPYMPYMRQDAVFRPGEPVSQRVVGDLLAAAFDTVVVVEPHLHRTGDLAAVFPAARAVAVSGAGPIRRHLEAGDTAPDTLVVGPDEESEPLVAAIAGPLGLDWAVARKERRGDRDVTVTLPDAPDPAGRPTLVVDDVISSGHTVLDCARALRARGAASVGVVAVHALHDAAAEAAMRAAGIGAVASCDGVPHASNRIPLASLIAEALRDGA
ncbi:ribose-phosphate diphosphokinase [Arenibaculum sp.]|uniref:ribose-phosphate diphosphokinase n=1 Tax=Arenibaculum sp. TaxID=2865862 RepID=UPI002E133235|nr:ribose-phosphate diphosphokinase [Arenibaculum sp.]